MTRTELFLAGVLALASVTFTASCKADAAPPKELANDAALRAARAQRIARASPGSPDNGKSPVGTNLAAIVDYSPEWPFVDAFKTARPWISSSESKWDDGRKLDLDEDGWVKSLKPGQRARALLFWSPDFHDHPAGEYEIVYDGRGTLDFWPQKLVKQEPGRAVIQVDPKQGIGIMITSTDATDPIRNIRVYLPGLGTPSRTATFRPEFLDSIRPYKVLRFMDWMNTNGSPVRTWSDRPPTTDATYQRRGVPLEVMVELANTLQADPWFTIPHEADDAYVEQFATYVRDRLDKQRLVYVEHSNEVWNSGFPQHTYALGKGEERKLGNDKWQAGLRWHSRRSVEIFKIFAKVFGEPGLERVVRVMGAQAANAWAAAELLEYEDAWKHTDALAIAPYFGGSFGSPENRAKTAAMTTAQLFDAMRAESLATVASWMKEQKKVANRFAVSLIAYEGGQHLVGVGPSQNDDKINALFDAANRASDMGPLYAAYLQAWRAGGGDLFVHYYSTGPSSKFGRWGARESLKQSRAQAPKYDALLQFIAANPIWWSNQGVR